MLARQRQERILAEVRATGGVRVTDLVDLLGVSDMTIRRDIAVLARKGLVARVHGSVFGEIRPATTIVEVPRLIDGDALIEIEADAIVA